MNETNLKISVGTVAGLASYIMGSINYLWVILAGLAVFDLITGILAAMYSGAKYDEQKTIKGTVIKVLYFIIIIMAMACDYIAMDLGIPLSDEKAISLVAILYFISAEGLSVIENLIKIGVPLPPLIKSFFEKINGDNK